MLKHTHTNISIYNVLEETVNEVIDGTGQWHNTCKLETYTVLTHFIILTVTAYTKIYI